MHENGYATNKLSRSRDIDGEDRIILWFEGSQTSVQETVIILGSIG